jgi:hypothetical protein
MFQSPNGHASSGPGTTAIWYGCKRVVRGCQSRGGYFHSYVDDGEDTVTRRVLKGM